MRASLLKMRWTKRSPLVQVEWNYIRRVLEKLGGNKYQTAQVLGIDRKTLYRKLSEMEEGKG